MASDNNAATVTTAPQGELSPAFHSAGREAQSPLDVLQVTRPERDRAGPQSAAATASHGGSSQLPGADPHDCGTDGQLGGPPARASRCSAMKHTCSVGPAQPGLTLSAVPRLWLLTVETACVLPETEVRTELQYERKAPPGGEVIFIVPQLIPVQKSPVRDESHGRRSSQKSEGGGGGVGFLSACVWGQRTSTSLASAGHGSAAALTDTTTESRFPSVLTGAALCYRGLP